MRGCFADCLVTIYFHAGPEDATDSAAFTPGQPAADTSASSTAAADTLSSSSGGSATAPLDSTEDDELVEYEGMLVTGAVAQRRG